MGTRDLRNSAGRLFGESHPRSKLTRYHVDLILELREDHHVSLGTLALWFGISKSCVYDITSYRYWVEYYKAE